VLEAGFLGMGGATAGSNRVQLLLVALFAEVKLIVLRLRQHFRDVPRGLPGTPLTLLGHKTSPTETDSTTIVVRQVEQEDVRTVDTT
jgi:hypothetical protein